MKGREVTLHAGQRRFLCFVSFRSYPFLSFFIILITVTPFQVPDRALVYLNLAIQ
jgi:hypothetical protein